MHHEVTSCPSQLPTHELRRHLQIKIVGFVLAAQSHSINCNMQIPMSMLPFQKKRQMGGGELAKKCKCEGGGIAAQGATVISIVCRRRGRSLDGN